jgi:hypothetical protein
MVNHHVIARSLAGGLVIVAAGLPSAAQARFDLNPPPAADGGVSTQPVHIDSPALGSPPTARVAAEIPQIYQGRTDLGGGVANDAASRAAATVALTSSVTANRATSARPFPQQDEAVGQSGFQWGDAGIGAAGAIVLVSAGAVTSARARRRRGQRSLAG